MKLLLGFAVWLALAGSVNAQAPSGGEAADADKAATVTRLIGQLGDARFAVRKRAQEELVKLGSEAFDLLVEAEAHDDPEVAMQAAYLVRQIRSQWTRDTDPRAIQQILKDYDTQNDERRAAKIRQLAELPGDQGLEWLCRLVRFEKSPVLSKQAALAIINSKPPADEAGWTRRSATISKSLARAKRPAVAWLEVDLQAHADPAGALKRWSELTEAERHTLDEQPQETTNQIVLALLRRKVELLDRLGRAGETEDVLKQMVLVERGDSATLAELIDWLVKRKAWSVIDLVSTRFAASFEVDAILAYTLCDARLVQGDQALAEATAEKALKISGESQQEHTLLGNRLSDRGMATWADREWQHAVKLGPIGTQWDIVSRKLLANNRHDQQRDADAAELLRQLVEAADKEPVVMQRVRTAQQQQPQMDISINALKSDMYFYESCLAATAKNVDKQREMLSKAVDQKQTNVEALIGLYQLTADMPEKRMELTRLIKEFVEFCRLQIEEDPEEPSFYNQIAWIVANTDGDLEEAIRLSQRSIELARNSGGPPARVGGLLDTLAHCYYAKKDYAQAIKHQEEAQRLDPQTASIGRALVKFREAQARAQQK